MRAYISVTLAAGALLIAASVWAAAASQQTRPIERAFDHYERIRAVLAQDSMKGIAAEAKALSPLAVDIAGADAGRAADGLAQAKDLEEARERFGTLSEALVPRFLEAELPGVHGFLCSMKQKRWVQRGSTVANPYYRKAMATCGTPIKQQGKS